MPPVVGEKATFAQVPPSALDSVVGLWDSNLFLVTWNDDGSVSCVLCVTYTVESADTFYISVESCSGYSNAVNRWPMGKRNNG